MQRAAVVDETEDAMQIVRDRIELGKRVAMGLRQENVVEWTTSAEGLARWPGMATNSADSAIRIRAIGAWSEMVRTYAQATGFPKEVYCR